MVLTRPFAAKEGWFRVARNGGIEELPELPVPSGMDPNDVLVLQLVAAQLNNQLLAGILQELQEQAQQGIVTAVTEPLPGGTPTPREILFEPPLFSISLTCDGPANVEYRIPNRSNARWVQLNNTEVIVFNFIKGLIPSIALRAVAPAFGAVNVRIVGTY
jgi:hypothetical protein